MSFKETKIRNLGISTLTTALVALVLVLAIGLGAISYQYSTVNTNSSQRNGQTETTTNVLVSTTTVTVTSTTTLVTAASSQPKIPTNMPETCLTSYPDGLDLNHSNYFIITNFTTNFAQVCVKYTYYPQNATEFTTNGTYDAMFNYSTMYFIDSFGNASQGGPMSNIVSPNPRTVSFNSTGESVVVDYTFQWSYIFSYFAPAYAQCGSTLSDIGIAQTNGDGTSGLSFSCPAHTPSDLFVAELVGTSYLKLATS